jgi:hypothetical protein
MKINLERMINMMEILNIIGKVVWIGVGVTIIGGTIYSMYWYKRIYTSMGWIKEEKKEEEAE